MSAVLLLGSSLYYFTNLHGSIFLPADWFAEGTMPDQLHLINIIRRF